MAEGLTRVLGAVPVGTRYLEAQGGWSSLSGPYLRGELGARLLPNLGLFGFVEWRPGTETMMGGGGRVTF